jgi:hypothetical protein
LIEAKKALHRLKSVHSLAFRKSKKNIVQTLSNPGDPVIHPLTSKKRYI